MHKFFNLQLLDDGGQGGAGNDQGGNAGSGNGGQAGNAGNNGGNAGPSYSFQQAEEIANARASRAERAALASYFQQQGLSEEQINLAIADYKAQQAAQKPNVDAITRERDEARAERDALKDAQTLRQKGVRDEDADYVMFKARALMKEDSKLDFDKAVTANTTLYAKWTQLFTLTFETNGGTKIDSVEAPDGSLVYLGSYKPTKSGYYFVGWYTDKNLTRASRVGYVRMDGNKTVYAKFAVADKTNPKTADPALPGLALAVLSFSTVGLAALGIQKRK